MPQRAGCQVGPAVVWIDDVPILVTGHRVDGEITPRKIFEERDLLRAVCDKPFVASAGFALRARECIFLVGLRVKKNGEVGAHFAEALLDQLVLSSADDDPVAVLQRQA